MNQETLLFFSNKPEALPLYEFYQEKVLPETENVTIKVQKSRIFGGKEIIYEQD